MEFDFIVIPNEQTPKLPDWPNVLVKDFAKENQDLLDAFLHFASKYPETVGLASNQCSLNGERIMHRFFAFQNQEANCWELMINPIIHSYLGYWEEHSEGCKTWPGKKMVVKRTPGVLVTYYDIHGDLCQNEIFTGFTAQIIQHETDHLNGVHQNMINPDQVRINNGPRPQRNDACPCGSEKKFKNCCLKHCK